MRRWLAVGVLALCAALGVGAPLEPEDKVTLQLPAFRQAAQFISFQGGQRARVIASGNGQSPLALYVFDPHGNCVARDDLIDPRVSSDDLAAEWYPPETGRYTIEVRNVGTGPNAVVFIAR